jgi:hypothetical protein
MPRDFKLNATKTAVVANVDIGDKQIVAVFTRDGQTFEASTAGVGKHGRDHAIAEVKRRIGTAPKTFAALLRQLRPPEDGDAFEEAMDTLDRLATPVPMPPHLRGRVKK